MKGTQFCLGMVFVVLATVGCRAQEFEAAPEFIPQLQCNVKCCGPEPEVPEDFNIFVADFTRVTRLLATPISRETAVADLSLPYLSEDQIESLAGISDAYYKSSRNPAIPRVYAHQCEIPMSDACNFKFCGCPVTFGRRLLQCLPYFKTCAAGVSAPVMSAPERFEGEEQKPVELVVPGAPEGVQLIVALCPDESCILFRIKDGKEVDIEKAADELCPDRRDSSQRIRQNASKVVRGVKKAVSSITDGP